MIRQAIVATILALAAMAQTPAPPTPPAKGSISGVARDVNTSVPVANAEITASSPPARPVNATSDAQGRFTLPNIDPGQVQLSARTPSVQGAGFGILTRKIVTLLAGQNLTDINIGVRTSAQISGTVRDQNDEPVPGTSVYLIAREYQLGELRYVFTGAATTDDQGKFVMQRVEPGRGYLLLAMRRLNTPEPISDAPLDPRLRRPAVIPTYYPGVDTVAGAQTLTLRSGEQRENVDIRLQRSAAFCLEGVLQGAAAGGLRFSITEASPHSGASGDGGMYVGTADATTGPDGKVRICNLHPGQYRIHVMPTSQPGTFEPPEFFATAIQTVTNRDSGIVISPLPRIKIMGELVWAETPVESFAVPPNWIPRLEPITRTAYASERMFPRLQAVGTFDLPPLFMDEYRFMLPPIPLAANVYVKDVTYGDHSVLREPFRPGSAAGDQRLRIILAHDGGKVKASVEDREGKKLADQFVMVLPKEIRGEAELADTAVSGQTDQNGAWTSATIAPGKYYVLASRTPFDRTPETIALLWGARDKGKEIEIAPGATVEAATSLVN